MRNDRHLDWKDVLEGLVWAAGMITVGIAPLYIFPMPSAVGLILVCVLVPVYNFFWLRRIFGGRH